MKPQTTKTRKRMLPNVRLRSQREQRHWTQTELARMLGTTYLSVCRWENGTTSPSLYYRKQLCELFDMSAEDLGLASPPLSSEDARDQSSTEAKPLAVIWHVPYRRNPFFTGREEILARLQTLLGSRRVAALSQVHAISGLGGVGKTQTAIEYAYRHRQDYQAILWTRAETRELLEEDLLNLAEVLHLPERNEQNQDRVLNAVRRWFSTHQNWLLILDNIEDMTLVDEILPPDSQGHILLTTREQATGAFAQRVDLEQMTPEEGALFLLHRIKLLGPDAPLQSSSSYVEQAIQIVKQLGGLPLALDQAGAYIEETACGLADYLERYRSQQASLLSRRGRSGTGHAASVRMTFSFLAGRLEQSNPAAIELLRLCAFLAPDAIPEEIIIEGAHNLGPILGPIAADPVKLDGVIADLRRYSLLRRNIDDRTLIIHRLVQVVIKDQMPERMQRQWAERCVNILGPIFPKGEFVTWPRKQFIIPQAQSCVALIAAYQIQTPEAAQLLNATGWHLLERAQYAQAEHLLKQALALREQVSGPEHPDTATILNNLATLAFYQGQYEQADVLLLRALAIRERVLGLEHLDTAKTLDDLGMLYTNQGHYAQAEPLFQQALAIEEKALGGEHPTTTATLNNLALLYFEQEKYESAEPLYQRVLASEEQTLGPHHLFVGITFDNLAKLYYSQGKYKQAEPLYQRALTIEKNGVGLNHPSTAITLSNLGELYHMQGQYDQAESFFRDSLTIKEYIFGPEHPDIAYTFDKLAKLYQDQGRYEEAEPLYQRALAVQEKVLGPEHRFTMATLNNLSWLYRQQGREEQADLLLQRNLLKK